MKVELASILSDLHVPPQCCWPSEAAAHSAEANRAAGRRRAHTHIRHAPSKRVTARLDSILGPPVEFETCPDWVPGVDTARPATSMMMKAKSVIWVRSPCQLDGKSSKRVQGGEPIIKSRRSRYLIDFTTSISGASSGLAPPDCDPGVDSNSSSDEHPETTRR